MTVFKGYFKVIKSFKGTIILYTCMSIFFVVFNMQSGGMTDSYKASTPDIAIVNLDTNNKVTDNLVSYLEANTNVLDISGSDEIADALFYRDITYVVYIYEGYGNDFINQQLKPLEVQSSGNFNSSYTQMLLERYFNLANTFNKYSDNVDEFLVQLNDTLKVTGEIVIENEVEYTGLRNLETCFSFMNYTLLAVSVYIVATVMVAFNEEKVKNRLLVSSKRLSSYNSELLLGNLAFTTLVWGALITFAFILEKETMMSAYGLYFALNSFVFMLCALAIGFLLGCFVKNKHGVSGPVNVIALGSSFLCGAFVPAQFLPSFVVNISKVLPSYWYISNNAKIAATIDFASSSILSILTNVAVIAVFAVAFVVIANVYTAKKARTR